MRAKDTDREQRDRQTEERQIEIGRQRETV